MPQTCTAGCCGPCIQAIAQKPSARDAPSNDFKFGFEKRNDPGVVKGTDIMHDAQCTSSTNTISFGMVALASSLSQSTSTMREVPCPLTTISLKPNDCNREAIMSLVAKL